MNTIEDENVSVMTHEQLRKVLQMKCFTITDLSDIARELNLQVQFGQSFKSSYKMLASKIHEIYNLHFAMVEGLHRICTVRNLMQGVWIAQNEEPNVENIFLRKPIQIRIHIHDNLTSDVKEQFRTLSLFNLKVKRSIVERTLYDELSNIANQMQHDDKLLPLNTSVSMFKQLGRCDSTPIHILYNHRYYIYETIANFAFDKNCSTELYNYQVKHLNTVVNSENIPDKKRYLNLTEEESIEELTKDSNESLFLRVAEIAIANLCKKAESFSSLHTKKDCRILDWAMKPIAQEIRIVITYLSLAAINMKRLNESIKLLNPRYKFETAQSRTEVDVLATMYAVVQAVDEVGDAFKDRVVNKDVHVTKIKQLVKMNIFQDLMMVLKKIGHNPSFINDAIKSKLTVLDTDVQSSSYIDLVNMWSIATKNYITNIPQSDTVDAWIVKFDEVVSTGVSKTDVKQGRFGCQLFDDYNIDEKLRLTYWVDHPDCTDLVSKPTMTSKQADSQKTDHESIARKKQKVTEETPILDHKHVARITNPSIFISMHPDCDMEDSDDDSKIEGTKSESDFSVSEIKNNDQKHKPTITDDNDVTPKPKMKKPRSSKKKQAEDDIQGHGEKKDEKSLTNKEIFTAPKRVQEYYDQMFRREALNLPVTDDVARIKTAWIDTINSVSNSRDVRRMWLTFMSKLFESVSGTNANEHTAVNSSDNHASENKL